MKSAAPKIHAHPKTEKLRQRVAGARSRLAGLEVELAREKSRVDAVQAVLFRHLREHYQKRDQLRLVVHYRQKFLDSFVRNNRDEVEQAEWEFKQAKAQSDRDYAEMAATLERKRPSTAGAEGDLTKSDFGGGKPPAQWKRLGGMLQKEIAAAAVLLKQLRANPDYELCRIAEQKPATFAKLTAKRAKRLAAEIAELKKQAEALAKKIRKLGKVAERIG